MGVKGKRGGAQPGAGRKRGGKNRSTIEKEVAREALRQIVLREMEPLVMAQIANAKGIRYLVARDKKGGKFTRVDREPRPGQQVGTDEEIIEVWAKDPSIQAFSDLMNRAIDRPKEQDQTVDLKIHASQEILAALAAGRERVAKMRRKS